jgi:hypothetical protein
MLHRQAPLLVFSFFTSLKNGLFSAGDQYDDLTLLAARR